MASSSPKYRVGASDFFFPGDLKADADTLDAQIMTLDDSTTANPLIAGDWLDSWLAWMNGWKRFWVDVGFFSITNGTRDQLISYESQFAAWYQQAQQQGASTPGPLIEPSDGTGATFGKHAAKQLEDLPLPSLTSIIIIAALLLGLFIASKVVK